MAPRGDAAALTAGDISLTHAQVVAEGTRELPEHVRLEADPVPVELAARLDPPQLRRTVDHLRQVADPEGADRTAQRHHERRGLWLAPTWEGMVALGGLLEPEAATSCWPPWSRWPARLMPRTPATPTSAPPTP